MKARIYIFFFILIHQFSYGQTPLDIAIEINEPYPVELEHYLNNADNLFITVSNTTGITQEIYYHVRLIGNNGVDVQTLQSVKPLEPVVIPPGYIQFYGQSELERDFPFQYPDDLDLSGLTQEQFDYISYYRALPEGTYQICITALDYSTDAPLNFNCSSEFDVTYGNMPYIYQPIQDEVVPASLSSNVFVGWEPPFASGGMNGILEYHLVMIDITDDAFGDLELMFANPGEYTVLDEPNIMNLNYTYNFPPDIVELEEGHQYAVRVTATDITASTPIANSGKSEIVTFWYGYNPNEESADDGIDASNQDNDCFLNCYYEQTISESPTASASIMEELFIGNFTITNLDFSEDEGSSASGTGEISIPFLNDIKVTVQFSNVSINNNGRIYSGLVSAVTDRSYNPETMNNSIAEDMNDFIRNGRIVGAIAGGEAMGMPLGLIQNVAGHNFMLGFTKMEFRPNQATCAVMNNFHIPQFGNEGWISMAMNEVCLIPAGFAGEYFMNPVFDYNIPYGGDMTIRINGTTSSDTAVIRDEATYLQMDCNGLKSFSLNGEVEFPESTLVKENDDAEIIDGNVIGSFQATFDHTVDASENIYAMYGEEGVPEEAGLHCLLNIDIDQFQISSVRGWGFEVGEAWLDISDYENPSDIVWPESYDDANQIINPSGSITMEPTWTGVYIRELELKTPPEFLGGNTREGASVNNMIIDPLVTMTIAVEDLISISDGEVDDWSLSMDSLFMTIVQNRIESGGFSGVLGMPITSEGSYLRYTALIEDSNTGNTSLDPPSYVFSINPEDPVELPFLIGKASLSENSHVLGKFTPGDQSKTYFEAYLEGGIGLSTDLFESEEQSSEVDFTLPLVDFNLGYHSQNGFGDSYFGFVGLENWDDTDPVQEYDYDLSWGNQFSEESLGGFPLSISSVELSAPSSSEVVFTITPSITLASGGQGISGDVGIDIFSEYKKKKGEQKLVFQKFGVSSISIDARPHGIRIEGSIDFYNDTAGSGKKGVEGELEVMLPMGIGAKMAAEFGRQVTNNSAAEGTSQNFGYWYLDGMVYFPVGLPLGSSGLGLYGFGGGVFVNMTNGDLDNVDTKEANSTMGNVKNLSASDNPKNNIVSRTDMDPNPSFGSYGLKLATTLGTMPSPLLMNMDVMVYGQFSSDLGINMLSVGGDVFHMCPITEREAFGMWASANFNWEKYSEDFNQYNGGIDLFLNLGVLKGTGVGNKVVSAEFLVENGDDNEWFLHAGNPEGNSSDGYPNYGGIEFSFPKLPTPKITAEGYFMAGHRLPDDLPIPAQVQRLMNEGQTSDGDNSLDNSNKVKSGGVSRDEFAKLQSQNATGLAFGAKLTASAALDAYLIYGNMAAYLGFDINITHSESRTCFIDGQGDFAPGLNGWYARGQVYAGLEGELGLRFKIKGKGFDLKLFELGAALMVSGGGPNPEWIEGRAGVYYSVLNGLFEGYEKFEISIGEQCIPEYEDPFGGLQIVYETYPLQGDESISPFVDPSVSFILPINEEFTIPILVEDGDTDDLTLKFEIETLKLEELESTSSSSSLLIPKGGSIPVSEERWTDDNKMVEIEIDQNLSEFTNHKLTVKLKAYEINGSSKTQLIGDDGETWNESKTIVFETGELPYPIPEDEIKRAFPIRNQRHFLQNDPSFPLAKLEFIDNLKSSQPDQGYFPEDNDQYDYTYTVRWQTLSGGEPIEYDYEDFIQGSELRELVSNYPEFQNDMIYSFQLVRKREKKRRAADRDINLLFVNNVTDSLVTDINLKVDIDEMPGTAIGTNEDLIYQYYFKTSRYNTISEKLNDMTVSVRNTYPDDQSINYPKIRLHGKEGFDIYDLYEKYDENDNLNLSPRFKVFCEDQENITDNGFSAQNFSSKANLDFNMDNPNIGTNKGISGLFEYIHDRRQAYYDHASPLWEDSPYPFEYTIQTPIIDLDGNTSTTEIDATEYISVEAPNSGELNYNSSIMRYDITDFDGVLAPLSQSEIDTQWDKYNQFDNIIDITKNGNSNGGSFIEGQFYGTENNDDLDQIDNPNNLVVTDVTIVENNSGILMNSIDNKLDGANKPDSSIDFIDLADEGSNQWNYSNENDFIAFLDNNNYVDNGKDNGVTTTQTTSEEVQLKIHFDLNQVAKSDADTWYMHAYDTYYQFPSLSNVDLMRVYEQWIPFVDEEYPEFVEGLESLDILSGYNKNKHKGSYKVKFEPNLTLGNTFIPGHKSTVDFEVDE